MKKQILILFLISGLLFVGLLGKENPEDRSAEENAVKKVVVDCYINGVITKGDAELARKGWHQDCDIIVFKDGNMKRYPASFLLKRIAEKPGPIETDVKYEFKKVMITGYAAVVVIKVYYKGKPKYMD